MLFSKTIIQKPAVQQENHLLGEIGCLIRSGYSAYEIQKQMNIGRGALKTAAVTLNLQEKLFRNTFS